MSDKKIHPGHAILRLFIPDTDARRKFVAEACSRDRWDATALNDAIERWTSNRPTEVQAGKIRAFIESI